MGNAFSMNSIADFKVFDLPVGAVGVGAVIGGVGDAVTGTAQGVVPQVPAWALKAGLAFATYKYAGKYVGKDAANIGAMFLTYDAAQELINVRGSVRNFTAGILAKLPLPSFGSTTTPAPAPASNYQRSPF